MEKTLQEKTETFQTEAWLKTYHHIYQLTGNRYYFLMLTIDLRK